ncbi:hypothetical protein AYI97_09435 [Shewanella algae]|nr:hypothetical protein AYI97_09435 [Shewanella algae]
MLCPVLSTICLGQLPEPMLLNLSSDEISMVTAIAAAAQFGIKYFSIQYAMSDLKCNPLLA